ncbi:NUDIX domain-containing protein [Hymenobacter sp. BT523]|uniref:NUDIX domain-containing protein n=1 Tax=Hymenobacter sp. BT523 TaxID=2795725 RepID=UPI0018EE1272|nr:NUDIX domain-containing protein [Hymenobacter sp. BT523]MBJ6107717.1 NUDIX domain-containing protein [Hymenobacter sp. BT523]
MSPYLKNLRNKVGPDLLLLPSVTILAFDADGKVLLVRHANHNVWVAPGGMVEVDEDPKQAAIREMEEETGCQVEVDELLGVYGGPNFRVNYQNGDEVAYVMTVYAARIVAGTPRPDGEETFEARFFTYADTLSLATGEWLPEVLKDVFGRRA